MRDGKLLSIFTESLCFSALGNSYAQKKHFTNFILSVLSLDTISFYSYETSVDSWKVYTDYQHLKVDLSEIKVLIFPTLHSLAFLLNFQLFSMLLPFFFCLFVFPWDLTVISVTPFFFLKKYLFIHLKERGREHEQGGRAEGVGEEGPH